MMQDETTERQAHRLFADILDYPQPGLAREALECEVLVAQMDSEAAALLRNFREFVEGTPLGRIEEVYSAFFDLNPVCYPYVGYHIFGESYKRSAFLLRLKEQYRKWGVKPSETELPDRLSVVLRFLSISGDVETNQELISEGVVPALDRMTGRVEKAPELTPEDDLQLEGHSEGEVLEGGFVLKAMETAEGEEPPYKEVNPYKQALLALRMVLGSVQDKQSNEPSGIAQGGDNHV